jgi:hypothetical protein
LQAIHVLDLANQVIGQRLHALKAQNVMWIRLTVCDNFAAYHLLTLEHVQVTPLRNQFFHAFAGVIRDDQSALTLSPCRN